MAEDSESGTIGEEQKVLDRTVPAAPAENAKQNIPVRTIDSEELGFKVLHEPLNIDEVLVDIVAVHGLAADPDWTWTYSEGGADGGSKEEVNWLKDDNMLHAALPGARIMRFGYNSVWYGSGAIKQRLANLANEMLLDLQYEREAIAASNLTTEEGILRVLEEGNETLVDVVREFTRLVNIKPSPVNIFCFFEQKSTIIGKIVGDDTIEEYIVNETSGVLHGHPCCGLPLDHLELNKYKSPRDRNYIRVKNEIVTMVKASKALLEIRNLALRSPKAQLQVSKDETSDFGTSATPSKPPCVISLQSRYPSAKQRIFDIPRILHPHFSGRQKYLAQIYNAFHSDSAEGEGTIVSVFGIAGVGKSQLCLKYAVDNKNEYSYGFYATASTVDQWLSSCDSIVRGLSLPEANSSEEAQRTQALKRWFSANQGWILVIDDVNISVINLLRETLPQHIGGHILFSTKDRYIASEFSSPGCCIPLLEMDPTEGKELVLKIYNLEDNSATAELAEKVNQELGGLPLALEQGTTCAVQRCWELSTLFDNLRENKQEIIRDPLQTPHHADIITTLDMALKALEPSQVALLHLILMMRPQALPLGILIDGGSNLVYTATTTGDSINRRQDFMSKEGKKWTRRFRKRFRTFIQPKAKFNLSEDEIPAEPNNGRPGKIIAGSAGREWGNLGT
ncbi:hypothetical protein ABW20_dc0110310 [Dactylellina cionopaga]|nr:hypothetical protein ABW20_dc0110310 [Dactylellina cionopaga]